ncbi:MAG: hypothetical protein F2817_08055, partial [Actinobacteria bacterium]|nr:hypothetical protein [Actinomycetota bacterium]
MSTTQPSVAATPVASRRGASPGVDPREADALRGAIERLGGRLETTRDMLDRLAVQAADAGRTDQREA